MASASFQIDPTTGVYGTADTAQEAPHTGGTVNCKIVDVTGLSASDIQWRIPGTDSNGVSAPSITLSGSPTGQIASFTFPAQYGRGYSIECKVKGGTGRPNGDTKTSAVYSLNSQGRRPFIAGETFEIDPTHGCVTLLNAINEATAGSSSGVAQVILAKAATTAALPANTYNSTTKRLTADANGALPSQDGVSLSVNDILLVKNEGGGASHTDNGPYKVIQLGDGSNPYILERSPLADEPAEIYDGMLVLIQQGTTNLNHLFQQVTNDPVLDTTALEFKDATPLVTSSGPGAVSALGSADAFCQTDGSTAGANWRTSAVLADAATLTFGRTNPATGFDMNVRNAWTFGGRDAGNANDATLLEWGLDTFYIGSAVHVDDVEVSAALGVQLLVGGVARLSVTSGDVALDDGVSLTFGAANPATTGTERWRSGHTVYGRDNANTNDAALLQWIYSDPYDYLMIGGGDHVDRLRLEGANHVDIHIANNSVLKAEAALITAAQPIAVNLAGAYARFGLAAGSGAGSAASQGAGRFQKDAWAAVFRNSAETVDIAGMSCNGSDTVYLGGAYPTRPPNIIADPAGTLTIKRNGANQAYLDGTLIYFYQGLRLEKISTAAASTYACTTSDLIVHSTYSATGTQTVTLPAPANGRLIIIKDAGFNAATYNITITPDGSELIDGASSALINTDGGEAWYYSDGTDWFGISYA